jgi:hypothetical protein
MDAILPGYSGDSLDRDARSSEVTIERTVEGRTTKQEQKGEKHGNQKQIERDR